MELSFELLYLPPVAIHIAIIAILSGIGGAVFFSPLFILILKLDSVVTAGIALIKELFGFSSGLLSFAIRNSSLAHSCL